MKATDSDSSLRVWCVCIFILHVRVVHIISLTNVLFNNTYATEFTCSSFEVTPVDLNRRFSWVRTRGENPLRAMSSTRAVFWLQLSAPQPFLPSTSPEEDGCMMLQQGKSGSKSGRLTTCGQSILHTAIQRSWAMLVFHSHMFRYRNTCTLQLILCG